MTHSWRDYGERGSRRPALIAVWLIHTFGRSFGRVLVLPIAVYFCIFSKGTARHSRHYLSRVLNRPVRPWHVARHFYRFSVTLMDRVFFFTNRFRPFRITVKGRELVDDRVAAGQGCLLLGAHVGSFEVLRTVGTLKKHIPIKALYNAHNSDMFDGILKDLNPDIAEQLIRMGEPDTMLQVREFIQEGGLVGVLGDRAQDGGRVQAVEFLGAPAYFPVWPFRLAAAIGCPIVLFFGLLQGGNRYEIVFEPFADKIDRDRIGDDTQLAELIGSYAKRIESHCRRSPYNWFNFFDYWQRPEGVSNRGLPRGPEAKDLPRDYARGLAGADGSAALGLGRHPANDRDGPAGAR